MTEAPFVADRHGYPTPDSVREALHQTGQSQYADMVGRLTMGGIEHEGSLVELAAHCKVEHLAHNYPAMFQAFVTGFVVNNGGQIG